MTLPFENDTKHVEKMLACESMKSHKGRNVIVFLSIFLTTVMLSGVISAGYVFYRAEEKYADMSPSPGADGFAIMGTQEQEEQIKQYSDVEWAALVKRASYKRLENPETPNCDVELFVTTPVFYKNNYVNLIDGEEPKRADDILISDTLFKRLSLPQGIGQKIPYTVTVMESGHEIKKEMLFSVCGVYKNPLDAISEEYEEIYTSQEFIIKYNPSILNKPGTIYIKLQGNPGKDRIYERLTEINDEVGGFGIVAKMKETDNRDTVIMTAAASFIIMLTAYFIIFNVFSISLASDVRYYGMMKTIGVTERQLLSVLNCQVQRIFFPALITGLAAGYGCGRIAAPEMLKLMDGLEHFYEPAPIVLPSCFVAFFVFMAVKAGCWQSFRKVGKISPVDAVRYEEPKRRNIIFASISMILSCIIISSVFTFFFGYNVTEKVNRQNLYDFKLMSNLYLLGNGSESYEPIPLKLCEELRELPFVKNMEIVYGAHSQPDTYEDIGGTGYYLRARIKNTGLLKADFLQAEAEGQTYDFDMTDGDLRIPVCGVNESTIEKTWNNGNFNPIDGNINPDKFKEGGYIIYQPVGWTGDNLAVHAGDKMDLQIYDDLKGEYTARELEVMAVVLVKDPYGRTQFSDMGICMLDKTFKQFYSGCEEMIGSVALDTDTSVSYQEQQRIIQNLISKHFVYQTLFSSKYNSTVNFMKERNTYVLIGLFLGVFFSIISIVNIANNIVNTVLLRKIAYARMQAVGMTKRQFTRLLLTDNLKVYGTGILLFIPLGAWGLNRYLGSFSIKYFILSVLIIVTAILILLVIISLALSNYLNKKTIIQRFHEIE